LAAFAAALRLAAPAALAGLPVGHISTYTSLAPASHAFGQGGPWGVPGRGS